MLNKEFTFPDKELGLSGTDDYTWNFKTHWPELTQEYIEELTGYNLANKAGSDEKAKSQIKLVSRLSKSFLMSKLLRKTRNTLEYFVAKDNDYLQQVLLYQAEIFVSGFVDGGWISMYETTDEYGLKSTIGMAAEQYLESSDLTIARYRFDVRPEEFHDGTY